MNRRQQRRMAMSRRMLKRHLRVELPTPAPEKASPRPLSDDETEDLLEHEVARRKRAADRGRGKP